MNQVDWSKAPEWAIEHGLANDGYGIAEFWIGETQHQNLRHSKPFPHGGGDPSSDSFHNYRRESFSFVTALPAPWNGEGLPPVGIVCEAHRLGGVTHPDHRWVPVQVLAHWIDDPRLTPVAIYMPLPGSEATARQGVESCFRPIRTPEQIDAEKKAKAIEKIRRDTDYILDEICASAVLAAGYRKQVAE